MACAAPTDGGETDDGAVSECGPTEATVARVIDGDTVELDSGERVRYLMIDTPEISGSTPDCWGPEAAEFNTQLVEGKSIELSYDVQCQDTYGRTLAYVRVQGVEVNTRMVEFGHACVLHIPPNGEDRAGEFNNLEAIARAEGRGVWGSCAEVTCD
jgi:micrococcal nuclease